MHIMFQMLNSIQQMTFSWPDGNLRLITSCTFSKLSFSWTIFFPGADLSVLFWSEGFIQLLSPVVGQWKEKDTCEKLDT